MTTTTSVLNLKKIKGLLKQWKNYNLNEYLPIKQVPRRQNNTNSWNMVNINYNLNNCKISRAIVGKMIISNHLIITIQSCHIQPRAYIYKYFK